MMKILVGVLVIVIERGINEKRKKICLFLLLIFWFLDVWEMEKDV